MADKSIQRANFLRDFRRLKKKLNDPNTPISEKPQLAEKLCEVMKQLGEVWDPKDLPKLTTKKLFPEWF